MNPMKNTRYLTPTKEFLSTNVSQRYHSIHARGERVQDVLKAAKEKEQSISRQEEPTAEPEVNFEETEKLNTTTATDPEPHGVMKEDLAQDNAYIESEHVSADDMIKQNPKGSLLDSTPEGSIPQPMIAHCKSFPSFQGQISLQNSATQDQGLKDLMMSWYWAGYYTGLYEGQQKASQNKEQT
jgi:hypothetical protein